MQRKTVLTIAGVAAWIYLSTDRGLRWLESAFDGKLMLAGGIVLFTICILICMEPFLASSTPRTAEPDEQQKSGQRWSQEDKRVIKWFFGIAAAVSLFMWYQSQDTEVDATRFASPSQQAPSTSSGRDRDCGDFSSWRSAQDFFLAAGGPTYDPHRLDADGDGIACE